MYGLLKLKNKLSASTGYPEEMLDENLDLEADLGIDSVQRAEIWFSLIKENGLDETIRPQKISTITQLATELAKIATGTSGEETVETAQTVITASSNAQPSSVKLDVWIERGRKKLAESTGYPEEMLDENLDLEADLGIDSVQRAEIWFSFIKEFGLDETARPQKIATLYQLASELAMLAGDTSTTTTTSTTQSVVSQTDTSNIVVNTSDLKIWIEKARKKLSVSTGYPEDMLGENLDLEADLGIDSVQRAEIWFSLIKENGLDETVRPQKIATITQLATELAKIATGENIQSNTASETVSVNVNADNSAPSAADLKIWIEKGRSKLASSTGYPEEMLDENLDLEADLGIDSVQRAEIWFSLIKENKLDESQKPQKIATLLQLATELYKLASGNNDSNSNQNVANTVTSAANPKQSPINELFYSGISSVSKEQIKAFDCKNVFAIVNSDKDIKSWETFFNKHEVANTIITVKSLLEADDSSIKEKLTSADTIYILCNDVLFKSTKKGIELGKQILEQSHTMFSIFRKMVPVLKVSGKRIICPISQDGAFGAGKDSFKLQGSFPAGFIRSLHYELTNCSFLIVDAGTVAWQEIIERTLKLSFSTIEIGIINNEWVYPTISTITKPKNNETAPLEKNDLVLVTGGARGIVFECVYRLAEKTKCKLLLTGRTEPAKGDELWLNADASEIDKLMHELEISLVKTKVMNLGDAKRHSGNCKSQWEVNHNLKRLAAAGVEVMYEKCDVVDPKALKSLIEKVQKTEKIRGIVHGAGVQKSKLFEELAPEAISRTIETKLNPLFVMLEVLDFSDIKLLSAFGSIAGLFGNMGQTDYALANDVLACAVSAIGQQYKNVLANTVEWTAWVGTGMATEAETKRFAEMGLNPVNVETGVNLYDQAIFNTNLPRLAAFNQGAEFASNRQLNNFTVASRPKEYLLTGENEVFFTQAEDIYVNQHLVQFTPVVPGTFVTEILMESLKDSDLSVTDVRFRRPLQVKNESLQVEIVRNEDSLLIVPKDRPNLEAKALVNLSFSGCNLKKIDKFEESKLPTLSDKIKKQLLEEGKKVGNAFYEKLDAHFSHVLKSGPIFRGAKAVLKDKNLFYGHIYLTDDAVKMFALQGKCKMNPIVADMAIQVAAAWGILDLHVMAIPYEFGEIHIYNPTTLRDAVVICEAIKQEKEEALLHITVRDWEGKAIIAMRNVTLKTIPNI
ncbi:MAG: SDR family NAD(P)-dependent oxidoreductase [Bacteroidales bacterium]|nr:SDR family NAD(P)-dependent oxidoreductase [Bacteroidales bacterium]